MHSAQYAVLLAQAIPRLSLHEIEWEISKAKGWALIHAKRIHDGEAMVWPDARLSALGRWWQRVKARFGAGGQR